MKKTIQYECEICGRKYHNRVKALECEIRGVPDLDIDWIGLIYEYSHNNYVGIFSIAEITPQKNSHSADFSSWAIRVEPYPRFSLDNQKCGKPSWCIESDMTNYFVSSQKVDTTEFIMMVEYLREKGITPKYYNEYKQLIILEK